MAFRTLLSRKTLGLGLVLQNESMNLLGLGFSHARKLQISYLTYDYGVLESAISGKIMKLHHQKHHQTYRTIYNKAAKQLDKATVEVDVSTVVKLQSEIKFNGEGISILFGGRQAKNFIVRSGTTHQLSRSYGGNYMPPYFSRSLASRSASESPRQTPKEQPRKDISTVDDPFDAPTYNIPEKPVSFAEGASYSVIILAGLGVAAIAGYAVFKELIFQPKEYKIFGKALERVQNDSQVTVRIGSPVTGYGQESRNRAARQRIPNRTWTDEDGIEHVEVNFYIRGPHGSGKVYSEMFKDNVDKQWKFTYLIVEIKSPSPTQLMLESYVPA